MMNRQGQKPLNPEQWENIKLLIETGRIERFNQIFDYVKRSPFAEGIGMNFNVLQYRLKAPKSFSFREVFAIADKIGITDNKMADLVIEQIKFHVQASKKG